MAQQLQQLDESLDWNLPTAFQALKRLAIFNLFQSHPVLSAAMRAAHLTILEDVIELPDLVSYHTIRLGDLAWREFVEEWSLLVPSSPRRLIYIAREPAGLTGYFFPDEIVPAPTTEHHDTPEFTGIEKWRSNEEVEDFLVAEGYCWQLYPVRMHHDQFCGPMHRAEIEAQRRSAALPGA